VDYPNREEVVREYHQEVAARLPIKPIAALAENYPQANLQNFALHDPNDVSTFGFVIDGVHYSGGCNTRFGPYPFCEVLSLPSYSLAKTVVAGGGLMLLEQRYPGVAQAIVADYVPECSGDQWTDVTLENLVDMASGNYASIEESKDEFVSYEGPLFGKEDHASKIQDSCTLFQRKAEPGSTFVYHSSDTYIAGTVMNAYLRKRQGPDQDFFRDLLVAEVFEPLSLSQTVFETQRSYDQSAQPFSGFGLILHADDILRYGLFLMNGNGKLEGEQVLDAQLLAATMQRDPADSGLDTQIPNFRYNNGMWAGKVLAKPECAAAEWIPFMSGYGGISVVLMPNDTVYYVFSDGSQFKWAQAAAESAKLKPFCEMNNANIQ
jgi:CubicO group peptidase (beta-lactamase class C family)